MNGLLALLGMDAVQRKADSVPDVTPEQLERIRAFVEGFGIPAAFTKVPEGLAGLRASMKSPPYRRTDQVIGRAEKGDAAALNQLLPKDAQRIAEGDPLRVPAQYQQHLLNSRRDMTPDQIVDMIEEGMFRGPSGAPGRLPPHTVDRETKELLDRRGITAGWGTKSRVPSGMQTLWGVLQLDEPPGVALKSMFKRLERPGAAGGFRRR